MWIATTGILKVGGEPILQAEVVGFEFNVKWLSEEWGNWSDLTNDGKFKELTQTAKDKLGKASQNAGKGKGKTLG